MPEPVRRLLDITVYVVDDAGRVEVIAPNPLIDTPSGPPADDRDAFGLPVQFLGPHSEAIWGAIGRTVAVSALLEDRLVTLLQTSREIATIRLAVASALRSISSP